MPSLFLLFPSSPWLPVGSLELVAAVGRVSRQGAFLGRAYRRRARMIVTYRGRIVAGVVVAVLAALLIAAVIVSQAHGVPGHLAQSTMAVVN